MTIRNGADAMVLLADGRWHRFRDLYVHQVQALTLIELQKAKLVELNMTSAKLSERGMRLFDRAVTRMLIQVDKKSEKSKTGHITSR
jgi:hypothetical protein